MVVSGGAATFAVEICGSAHGLPGAPVPTELIAARTGRDAARIREKTGIESRHFADPETSFSELGVSVLAEALRDAELQPKDVARTIFVSSTGGDFRIPANANRLQGLLGLGGDAFDVNNACMGFMTAQDIAVRSVCTGTPVVAVVVVELLSRNISAENPRPYAVLADGAAAVIYRRSEAGAGFGPTYLRNRGEAYNTVTLAGPDGDPAGLIQFQESNRSIGALAIANLKEAAQRVLNDEHLTIGDVDWVLLHQPNGSLLARAVDALQLDPEKVESMVSRTGSLGAASIPVSLDALRRRGALQSGQRVLFLGVGAGVAYGAVLYRVG